MPRCQPQTTINNNLNKVASLQSSNPATVGSEKCNTVKAQDKDFKMAFMNMLAVLKEEMDNPSKKSMNTETVE